MKNTNLSYEEILKLLDGDTNTFIRLTELYDSYINTLCYSQQSHSVDLDEKQELLLTLFLAVKKFEIK